MWDFSNWPKSAFYFSTVQPPDIEVSGDHSGWADGDASFIPCPSGVVRRKGLEFIAAFDEKVSDLRIRRGRLTVKDENGMTHIVPTSRPS